MTLKNKICIDCGKECSGTRCMSCANKGKNNPAYGKQYRLGVKHTEEAKKKMVETRRKNGTLGKMTDKMKEKISKALAGENSPNWKGGITKEYKKARWNYDGKKWRKAVLSRDNYTCQAKNCIYCKNKIGLGNTAHHIKLFADNPSLRDKVDNGITYCYEYHKKEVSHKREKHRKSLR